MKVDLCPLSAALLLFALLGVLETSARVDQRPDGFTDGDRTFIFVDNGPLKKLGCTVLSNSDMHGNSTVIPESLDVMNVSKEVMAYLENVCRLKNNVFKDRTKRGSSILIYPGTKWCGIGDKAQHDEDLGVHRETDTCCRAHDKCPLYINRLSWAYGLYNGHLLLPRLGCDCEEKFYNCLKASTESAALIVREGYFFLAGDTCLVPTGKIDCIPTSSVEEKFGTCQKGPSARWGKFTKPYRD